MGFFKVQEELDKVAQKALDSCRKSFEYIDEVTEYNQQKVLSAFIKNG